MNWRMVELCSIRNYRALKIGLMYFCLFIAISLLTSGCSLLPKEDEGLAPPLVVPKQDQLQLYTVKRGNIVQRTKGTAVFEPARIANYQFELAGGVIQELHVKSGDQVLKGDLLAELRIDGMEILMKQRELEVVKKQRALQAAMRAGNDGDPVVPQLELEIAQLQLDDTKGKLENARLRSTMDGTVVFVEQLKPGDRVESYQIVASVADPSDYLLYYQVTDPDQIADVEVGMQAAVTYEGKSFKGSVVQTPKTAPYVEDKRLADQYQKRLYINTDEPVAEAKFGAFAEIEIVTQQRENVLVIPKGALRTYLGRNYVLVMDGDSRQEADVQTGLITDTEVEIVSGLEEGQQVING